MLATSDASPLASATRVALCVPTSHVTATVPATLLLAARFTNLLLLCAFMWCVGAAASPLFVAPPPNPIVLDTNPGPMTFSALRFAAHTRTACSRLIEGTRQLPVALPVTSLC